MQVTLDGMVRALRLKAHDVVENASVGKRRGGRESASDRLSARRSARRASAGEHRDDRAGG